MKYINNNTGEVRDFACAVSSNIWKPCESKASSTIEEKAEKPVKKTRKKEM